MNAIALSAKGQLTLRKEFMSHLGIQPGDKVEVECLPDGRIGIAAAQPRGSMRSLFGMLKRPNIVPLTLEQIEEAAAAGWAGER